MITDTSAQSDASPTSDHGWRRTTSLLSAGQLVSWGILYYAFAVYLPQMHVDLGWSMTAISAGFAIATIVSGLAAPAVGRIIDRTGSRTVMTLGATVGVAGLALWATAHHPAVFYAAFAVIGLAHATTLYAPAFATVVRHHPSHSRKAIVTITLAGGLASTVFSPLAQLLSDHGTWRTGLAVLTVGLALTVIPLNYHLPDDKHPSTELPRKPSPSPDTRPGDAPRRRPAGLWWVAAVWTLTSGVSVAFAVHIVAFLIDNGHNPAAAAAIAGAAGLGKVAGRALIAAGFRFGSTTVLRASLFTQAAFLALPLVWGTTTASLLMVAIFGATSGALTVLRPILVAELFGPTGFATKNGEIQLITTLSRAAAPVLAGLAVTAAGYTTTWTTLALVVLAAVAFTYRIDTHHRHT